VQAGASAIGEVAHGHAVRIFTGAPMPQGTDSVFMHEDVQGHVVLPPGLKAGANVRPAGEDVAVGQEALKAGTRLRPQDVALIAAFGLTTIDVRRHVRGALFSTGDEVVSPGAARRAAQLYDSNRVILAVLLKRLGCEASDRSAASRPSPR
jgi:molybdopterin molybdotransferase